MTSPGPIDKSHGFETRVPENKTDDTSKLTEHHASALPEALGERDETMDILNALKRELAYSDTIAELEGLLAQEIPAAVKKLKPEERAELRKLLPTLAKPTGDDKWHISSQRSQIDYALRDLEYKDSKQSEKVNKFEQIKERATNASRTVRIGVSNSMLGQKLGSFGQKIKEGFRNLPAVFSGLLASASNALFPTKTEMHRRDSGYEEAPQSEIEETVGEDKSSEVYSGISQTDNDDQETSSDTTEIELPSKRTRLPPSIIDNSVKDLLSLDSNTLAAYAKDENPEKANFINFLIESKGESLDNIKNLSTMWLDEQQSALINKATDHTQMLQALQKVWSALP